MNNYHTLYNIKDITNDKLLKLIEGEGEIHIPLYHNYNDGTCLKG